MADEKAPDATPDAGRDEPVHPAKVGEKDAGHKVSTAAGERVDGRIADIADGD
jgi:hypothetical protein